MRAPPCSSDRLCLFLSAFVHFPLCSVCLLAPRYLQSHVSPKLDRLGHDRGGEGGIAHVEDPRGLGDGTYRLKSVPSKNRHRQPEYRISVRAPYVYGKRKKTV